MEIIGHTRCVAFRLPIRLRGGELRAIPPNTVQYQMETFGHIPCSAMRLARSRKACQIPALHYNLSMHRRLVIVLLVVLGIITACMPPTPMPTELPATPNMEQLMQTSVFEVTKAAVLTQAAQPSATFTPLPTATNTPIPTVIATIARTPTEAATATPEAACNRAGMGTPFDLTISDGTQIPAGETFTKTWRLVNSGSCKWTRLYKLVFFSQNPLGAAYEHFLPGEVLPGYAVDLSIEFTAPLQLGTYRSNWMLQAPDGTLFGLGMNADTPFYVSIEVVEPATSTSTPSPTP